MIQLEDTGLPPQVLELLSSPRSSNDLQLVLRNLGLGYTAIRDEDLPIARQVCLMVAASFGSVLMSFAPNVIATLIFFLIDIRKKGIPLTTIQGRVLKELRSYPGLSAPQITVGLNLKEEEVAETLDTLKSVANLKKHLIPLVEEREDHKWYALEV